MREIADVESMTPALRADLVQVLEEGLPKVHVHKAYGAALVAAYIYGFLPRMITVAALASPNRTMLQRSPLIDPGFAKPRAEFFKNHKFTSGIEAQLLLFDTMREHEESNKLAKLNAQLNLNLDAYQRAWDAISNVKGLVTYLHMTSPQKPNATITEITYALLCGMPGALLVRTHDSTWREVGNSKEYRVGDDACNYQKEELLLATRHEWTPGAILVTEGTPVPLGLLQKAQPQRVAVQHSNFRYQKDEIVCRETWTFDGSVVELHDEAPAPEGADNVRAICTALLQGAPIKGAQPIQQLATELQELCNHPQLQQKVGLSRLSEERVALYLTSKLGEGFRLEDLEKLPDWLHPKDLAILTGVDDAGERLMRYLSTTPDVVTIDGVSCKVTYKRDQKGLDIIVHLGRRHDLLFSSVNLELPFYDRGSVYIELDLPSDKPDTFTLQQFQVDTLGMDQIRKMVAGYLNFVPGPLDFNCTLEELIKKVMVKQPPIAGHSREPSEVWLAAGEPTIYKTPEEAFSSLASRVKAWLIENIINPHYTKSMLGEPLHERLAQRLADALFRRLDNREVQLHQASVMFSGHFTHPHSDSFWVGELDNCRTKLTELNDALDGIQSPREDNTRVRHLRNAARRAMDEADVVRAVNYLEHALDALTALRASRKPRPEPRRPR